MVTITVKFKDGKEESHLFASSNPDYFNCVKKIGKQENIEEVVFQIGHDDLKTVQGWTTVPAHRQVFSDTEEFVAFAKSKIF